MARACLPTLLLVIAPIVWFSLPFSGYFQAPKSTAYYLPGSKGWENVDLSVPKFSWNPSAASNETEFVFHDGHFGFTIIGNTNHPVIIEATSDLNSPVWETVSTNRLDGNSAHFRDFQSPAHQKRFFRFRSP